MDIDNKMPERLKNCLNSIKDASEMIWNNPKLTHYTNHNIDHSKNIITILNKTLETAPNNLLNEHELFVLLASAYLHDIGMQTTLSLDNPDTTNPTLKEKEIIRNNHHKCSKKLILDSIKPSGISLGLEQCVNYIQFISTVVESHSSKVEIDEIKDTSFKGEDMKLKLLSALLKLADELDKDFGRVNISELKLWNIPVESKFHWWTHYYTQSIQIRNGKIKLFFRFPEEYCDSEIEDIFIKRTVNSVKEQLDEVHEILWENQIKLYLDDKNEIQCLKDIIELMPSDLHQYIVETKLRTENISLKTEVSSESGFKTVSYWYSDDILYADNIEVSTHYRNAYDLVNNGKYLDAIEEADNGLLLTTTPKQKIGILLLKGNCYGVLKDIDNAEKYHQDALKIAKMERVNEIYKEDAVIWQWHALVSIAMDHTHKREFYDAIEYYDKALKIDSNSYMIFLNKGGALAGLEKYDEAIKCFDEAIKINVTDTALVNKGIALGLIGKYKDAIKCFDEAIKLNSNNDTAFHGKGTAFLKLKEYKKAIKYFKKAIKKNPKNEHALSNKGIALGNLRRYDEAIKCFDKSIEVNPTFHAPYTNKGGLLMELGEYDSAIECFDKAIELNKKEDTVFINKGLALSDVEDAIHLNRSDIESIKNMDPTKREKYENAVKCFDEAIKLNSEDSLTFYYKGVTLIKLGKCKDAIKCFDKTIELNPNYDPALINKGHALYLIGEDDEAIKCFDKSMQINPKIKTIPNNEQELIHKGVSLDNLGKYDEAIQNYDEALKINRRNCGTWNNKGYSLFLTGKSKDAIKCFDKALKLNPNFDLALINKDYALKDLSKYGETTDI